jgi:hypothetical protein
MKLINIYLLGLIFVALFTFSLFYAQSHKPDETEKLINEINCELFEIKFINLYSSILLDVYSHKDTTLTYYGQKKMMDKLFDALVTRNYPINFSVIYSENPNENNFPENHPTKLLINLN